jgi:CDP-diacylglycerol--glycerol-3-phosphate 3-phosphatidyltransferase
VIAAAVFALAALTDGLDGYFARSRGSVTTFGKLMDPLADKLLIVGALVSLVSLNRLEAWVAMVIIAREVAVTILRTIAAERGIVIAASWLGKLKTVLQIAAVIALIVADPAPLGVDLLVYAALVVTVISAPTTSTAPPDREDATRMRIAARKSSHQRTTRAPPLGPSTMLQPRPEVHRFTGRQQPIAAPKIASAAQRRTTEANALHREGRP